MDWPGTADAIIFVLKLTVLVGPLAILAVCVLVLVAQLLGLRQAQSWIRRGHARTITRMVRDRQRAKGLRWNLRRRRR